MDQIKQLLKALSMRQQILIVVAAIGASLGIYELSHWQTEANFRPLYNSLSPEDAGVVVQKLKESSTPYRLSNNGTTVLVPDEKVAELRLEMAGAGVPKSGRIGFEIFDKTNFGMTDFAEHVNYRRALEGELERSVMSVGEIEQARVHISLPQESVFLEGRQPAKASVLVKIRAGATLPETAMPAITNLVASAVEGLAPEHVSVLDMRGNLLNRPKRTGANTDETSDTALEYRKKVEQNLAAKLDSTIEPLVGAGRFRTAVSAECEINSGEQSEESFDPTHSVMVSSQKTEDTSTPQHAAGGVPGTATNLPDGAQRPAAGPTTSRKTENVNFQTAHTVKRMVLQQGAIKRLSVSVLIDQDVHFEGTGADAKRVLVAPSPERMKTIHDLVAAAAGISAERGDQLIVESLPFESTMNLDPPPAPLKPSAPGAAGKRVAPMEQFKANPKLTAEIGAGFAAVLSAIVFLLFRMKKARARKAVTLETQQTIPQAREQHLPILAANPEMDSFTPSAVTSAAMAALPPGRVEVLTTQLRAVAQKDAEVCAGVLRGWLREEKA